MAFFTRLTLLLFGTAIAILFAFGIFFWLIFYVAFASMRWLVTGQKPQVLMMWQQIQRMRKGMRPTKVDIAEEVVVREVRKPLPPPRE